MPTHKNKPKKIVIAGVEVPPINKHKLPLNVDWQSRALEKKKELAEK